MITIVVPSFNHEKFLKQRIDSILAQTYRDFEVIILEDNSLDDSRQIIEQYRTHEKVKAIIYNKQNSGSVFKQWIKGIEISTGEFIWIAESDDYADVHFLEKMVPVLESDPSISMAYCNAFRVDENNLIDRKSSTYSDLRNTALKTKQWSSSFIMDGQEFLKNYLSKRCCVNNASAVLFRGSALIKSLPQDLGEFKYTGDWAVYASLATQGKIAYLNEPLSYYRDHSQNASKKASKNSVIFNEIYKIMSVYYNYLTSKEEKKKYVYEIRNFILAAFIKSNQRIKLYKEFRNVNSLLLKSSIKFIPKAFIEALLQKLKK